MTHIESFFNSVASPFCRQPQLTIAIVVGYVALCAVALFAVEAADRRRQDAYPPAPEPPTVPLPRRIPAPERWPEPEWDDTSTVRAPRVVLTVSQMVLQMDHGEPVIDALLGEIGGAHP
jgi:hypothetical protein